MPAAIKTPNIGLNQWSGNEYVKRSDFVEDNRIIDEEMGKLAKKANIIVTQDANIERQEGSFYFIVTEKQSSIINSEIKVSPNMGIKVEE